MADKVDCLVVVASPSVFGEANRQVLGFDLFLENILFVEENDDAGASEISRGKEGEGGINQYYRRNGKGRRNNLFYNNNYNYCYNYYYYYYYYDDDDDDDGHRVEI